jgi:ATP-dependent HslUV protease ATP-binding subunit HslU
MTVSFGTAKATTMTPPHELHFAARDRVRARPLHRPGRTKRAVAIALRNCWRRLQLDDKLRGRCCRILMIGPTGVGGRDRTPAGAAGRRAVHQGEAPIHRSPCGARRRADRARSGRGGIAQTRERKRKDVSARAHLAAEERVVNALVGANASQATKDAFRRKLRANELDDKEIEIEVQSSGSGMPMFEIPGMPGAQMGAISIGDLFGKALGGRSKTRRVTVRDSYEILVNDESDKLLDQEQLISEALRAVESNGIVFLDELDKICARDGRIAPTSRAKACSDLLPLIEGTTVSTKHARRPITSCSSRPGPSTSPSRRTCCPNRRVAFPSGSSSRR